MGAACEQYHCVWLYMNPGVCDKMCDIEMHVFHNNPNNNNNTLSSLIFSSRTAPTWRGSHSTVEARRMARAAGNEQAQGAIGPHLMREMKAWYVGGLTGLDARFQNPTRLHPFSLSCNWRLYIIMDKHFPTQYPCVHQTSLRSPFKMFR
jgi:hypothetical protein